MLDNNICLHCLLYNHFTEDQLESYQDGNIEVITTDGDEVCECCGELKPIVTYYGSSSEGEDNDEEDYCEACYAYNVLTAEEYEQWDSDDLELYTGDYEGTCCCCGKYTGIVSSIRRPEWGE